MFRRLLMLLLVATPFSSASNIPRYIFGTNASMLKTPLCIKHRCKVEEKSSYISIVDGQSRSYQTFEVRYRYPPHIASSNPSGNQARITILRDKRNDIEQVYVEFNEYYDQTQIISYVDSQFSTELLNLFIGKNYQMHPHRGDDMNDKCYRFLDRDNQFKILTTGTFVSSSKKSQSYVVYCAIYPGSEYPGMFPRHDKFYRVAPVLVISRSVDFKPAKQFTP
ncbi:hypothetical protein Deipe_3090 [Deinococcus peraridilitoris DSM 19664]|uniref:Uncharacterized protein n=1 Tax=Deinococcus peraridilitoris (strain DSM 19664 / LMG 22246 / CIP 109416 / KR-200) TaxID=937777 RepID=L0A3R4_DEIPD|nr:hypothetical protein Deipe_3090 [Deinococcus peraridilitoris DSM 19664]